MEHVYEGRVDTYKLFASARFEGFLLRIILTIQIFDDYRKLSENTP